MTAGSQGRKRPSMDEALSKEIWRRKKSLTACSFSFPISDAACCDSSDRFVPAMSTHLIKSCDPTRGLKSKQNNSPEVEDRAIILVDRWKMIDSPWQHPQDIENDFYLQYKHSGFLILLVFNHSGFNSFKRVCNTTVWFCICFAKDSSSIAVAPHLQHTLGGSPSSTLLW